jgi:hypothetical protein
MLIDRSALKRLLLIHTNLGKSSKRVKIGGLVVETSGNLTVFWFTEALCNSSMDYLFGKPICGGVPSRLFCGPWPLDLVWFDCILRPWFTAEACDPPSPIGAKAARG